MENLFTLANAPYLWLALGALFLVIEVMGATGVGFLFAGLGAIVAGIATHFGWADSALTQTSWFFLATVFWAIILWKPMQKFRTSSGASESFSNMVGDEAVVISGLQAAKAKGKVKWSGTTMNAQLAENSPLPLLGSTVIITQVDGTLLRVKATESGE